jgi:2-polyprenyl-6-methoxyphenol hydroxylase-like FAD-dependent oxidoreductase
MSPFQGQGANCGLLDGVRLADYFARLPAESAAAEELAGRIETELVERGGKFALESASGPSSSTPPARSHGRCATAASAWAIRC